MTDHNFNVAKNWFEDLQNQIIKIITEIDRSEEHTSELQSH